MRWLNAVSTTLFAALCLGCCCHGCFGNINSKAHQQHVAKLKAFESPEVAGKVDPDFYDYPGFRDWWRFPLAYPYSIVCIDTFERGTLSRYDGKTKIAEGKEIGVISDLVEFVFDGRFLVGRTVNREKTKEEWVLFEFRSGTTDAFGTKEELAEAARKRGYSGDMSMSSIETQYAKCFP